MESGSGTQAPPRATKTMGASDGQTDGHRPPGSSESPAPSEVQLLDLHTLSTEELSIPWKTVEGIWKSSLLKKIKSEQYKSNNILKGSHTTI